MPLFALAFDPRASVPERAEVVTGFGAQLPFYPGPAREWKAPSGRCALWVLEEEPGAISRVACAGTEMAAFFGRPIVWEGDRADGRRTLDPACFHRPAEHWAPALDGRCAVLRHDDATGVLEVYTDPLGSYPLYRADAGGAVWICNSPDLLARLAHKGMSTGDDHVAAALAGIVGGGWSLSGDPPVAGVRRLAPETVWRFSAAGAQRAVELLDLESVRAHTGVALDGSRATQTASAALEALADWPGRPSVVPLTGGRDSRLVYAAALGRFPFSVRTGGGPADPDVTIARSLCERTGVAHELMGAAPGGDRWSDPVCAARVLWTLTGGTASLANGPGFPLAPWDSPRPLWHSGQGGETARRVVRDLPARRSAALDVLTQTFLGRRPGRPDLLSPEGVGLVRDGLGRFLEEMTQAGFRSEDLPDLYYLRQRMGVWAGPTHAAVEPIRDVTSVLWSRRMLPHLLAGSVADRRRERLHREVVGRLVPDLFAAAFQDGTSWTDRGPVHHPRVRRARTLAAKARREARRRMARRRSASPPLGEPAAREAPAAVEDPQARLIALTRGALAADAGHPAWLVLDRDRVEALLATPTSALDEWRWYQVWRLATLFLPRTGDVR